MRSTRDLLQTLQPCPTSPISLDNVLVFSQAHEALVGCSTMFNLHLLFCTSRGVYLGPQTLIHESLQAQKIVKPSLSAQHFAEDKQRTSPDQQVRNGKKYACTSDSSNHLVRIEQESGSQKLWSVKDRKHTNLKHHWTDPYQGRIKYSMTTWKTNMSAAHGLLLYVLHSRVQLFSEMRSHPHVTAHHGHGHGHGHGQIHGHVITVRHSLYHSRHKYKSGEAMVESKGSKMMATSKTNLGVSRPTAVPQLHRRFYFSVLCGPSCPSVLQTDVAQHEKPNVTKWQHWNSLNRIESLQPSCLVPLIIPASIISSQLSISQADAMICESAEASKKSPDLGCCRDVLVSILISCFIHPPRNLWRNVLVFEKTFRLSKFHSTPKLKPHYLNLISLIRPKELQPISPHGFDEMALFSSSSWMFLFLVFLRSVSPVSGLCTREIKSIDQLCFVGLNSCSQGGSNLERVELEQSGRKWTDPIQQYATWMS